MSPISISVIKKHIQKYHEDHWEYDYKTLKVLSFDSQDVTVSIMRKSKVKNYGFSYVTVEVWEQDTIDIPYLQYTQKENQLF